MTLRHSNFSVILIHGFLGSGADWELVRDNRTLQAHGEIFTPTLPCHGESPLRLSRPNLTAMACWLADYLNELSGRTSAAVPQSQLLVGYSLGGRILLTLAAQIKTGSSRLTHPEKIAGMVIESAHPGLPAQDQAARRQHDKQWSQRFSSQPISQSLFAWYQQNVFFDLQEDVRVALVKRRSVNDPKELAKVVMASSLAEQPDYRKLMLSPPCPMYYWYGARDRKFRQVANSLSELSTAWKQQQGLCHSHAPPVLTVTEFPHAGHNCHLAEPTEYARQLSAVLSALAF